MANSDDSDTTLSCGSSPRIIDSLSPWVVDPCETTPYRVKQSPLRSLESHQSVSGFSSLSSISPSSPTVFLRTRKIEQATKAWLISAFYNPRILSSRLMFTVHFDRTFTSGEDYEYLIPDEELKILGYRLRSARGQIWIFTANLTELNYESVHIIITHLIDLPGASLISGPQFPGSAVPHSCNLPNSDSHVTRF